MLGCLSLSTRFYRDNGSLGATLGRLHLQSDCAIYASSRTYSQHVPSVHSAEMQDCRAALRLQDEAPKDHVAMPASGVDEARQLVLLKLSLFHHTTSSCRALVYLRLLARYTEDFAAPTPRDSDSAVYLWPRTIVSLIEARGRKEVRACTGKATA